MLNWGNRFNICCFLDNHNYHLSHHSIECVLAAGVDAFVSANAGNALQQLSDFAANHADWMFGHLSYDLKNEIEPLQSNRHDGISFPDLYFFVPRYVVQLAEDAITIGSSHNDHEQVLHSILNESVVAGKKGSSTIDVKSRYSRSEYTAAVEIIQQHILRGDCYELNLCQEFYSEKAHVDPLALYMALSNESPNPFSAYYKVEERYLACLSPERYLKKEGRKIISQPIKGTSRRVSGNISLDEHNLNELRNSEKERAENIMVVDLVRNDLSKICEEGSVQVDELCGVYTFPQVHQMISTVSGILRENVDCAEAIRATFPMGSMTGAPKKKVMELIEKYERSRRGLFSGSIGYITPYGDFDFNVVIRSVLYNQAEKYLSFHTGSAITFSSDADAEFEECMLKAAAIKKALAETNTFH